MRRATFLLLLLTWALARAGLAQISPIPGVDYRVLSPPQAAENAAAVEVIEFFWYRCPHCYALEPALESWLKRLPAKARFTRVPAVFGDEWKIDARLYYTLETVGELRRLHRPLYEAIHREGGRQLRGKAYAGWVLAWLDRQGVDMPRFSVAFDSAQVRESVARATALTRLYGVSGTPNFGVGGRYVVTPPPGDGGRILQIAGQLIGQIIDRRSKR